MSNLKGLNQEAEFSIIGQQMGGGLFCESKIDSLI